MRIEDTECWKRLRDQDYHFVVEIGGAEDDALIWLHDSGLLLQSPDYFDPDCFPPEDGDYPKPTITDAGADFLSYQCGRVWIKPGKLPELQAMYESSSSRARNENIINISDIQNRLEQFAADRDWNQFHSPKNIAMALAGETGELVEIFQWLTEEQSYKIKDDEKLYGRTKEELADVALYLLRLADKLDIDLLDAINRKLEINAEKYPVSLAKGNATKYNQRD